MTLWWRELDEDDAYKAVIVDGATIGYSPDLVAAMDNLAAYGFARMHAIAMIVKGETTATAFIFSTAGIKGIYRAPAPNQQPSSQQP